MLIPVVRIVANGSGYLLKEVFINPRKIVYMAEEHGFKQKLSEGVIKLGLHPDTLFTIIKINMSDHIEEMVLIGDPRVIESKFYKVKKRLLRD